VRDLEMKNLADEIKMAIADRPSFKAVWVDGNKVCLEHKNTGRRKVITVTVGPSMTQQQFADEADINKIIKKFEKRGERLPTGPTGVYADLTEVKGLAEALATVDRAQSAFMGIPAETRLKFDNDPVKLVAFLSDKRNDPKAVELGLKDRSVLPVDSPKPLDDKTTPKA
jgi:cytochrome c551/c552